MTTPETVIFFDLETGGLQSDRHPIIQLSAAAVAWDTFDILEEIERKIKFDETQCEAQALSINSYSPMLWADARPLSDVLQDFTAFCRRHACIAKRSKVGREYHVAQLAAYNAGFDMEFLQLACKQEGLFLPAEYHALCVLQRAKWFFKENRNLPRPVSFKLTDVCAALGVEHRNAHDATGDNYAQIGLLRKIRTMEGAICATTD